MLLCCYKDGWEVFGNMTEGIYNYMLGWWNSKQLVFVKLRWSFFFYMWVVGFVVYIENSISRGLYDFTTPLHKTFIVSHSSRKQLMYEEPHLFLEVKIIDIPHNIKSSFQRKCQIFITTVHFLIAWKHWLHKQT